MRVLPFYFRIVWIYVTVEHDFHYCGKYFVRFRKLLKVAEVVI